MEFEAPDPELGPHDLLVEVKAVSVNPVDVKVRGRFEPGDTPKVIGYDAAGVVQGVGSAITLFKAGDEVFYAGDLTRPGTNSQFHAVDERIVGRKPDSLPFTDAAALPLTSITAWEILFDCLRLDEGDGRNESILVIGAAGGVGSILIQLVKKLTRLRVIATASRPETVDWVRKMGADDVINHHDSLVEQVKETGHAPRYVASLNQTDQHFQSIVELIEPRGHIALIDDPPTLELSAIKPKSLSFSWEFMFARSMFQTHDMIVQHQLLNRISDLIDQNELISTATKQLGSMTPETLHQAHLEQQSGKVVGKNVLDVA